MTIVKKTASLSKTHQPPWQPKTQRQPQQTQYSSSLTHNQDDHEEHFVPEQEKKAKKSLNQPCAIMTTENEATGIPADEGGDLDFTTLKKKKRCVIDAEVAELEAKLKEARLTDERGATAVGGDPFGNPDGAEQVIQQTQDDEEHAWLQSDRDSNYEQVPIARLISCSRSRLCNLFL